jgi:hypothetical protein
MVIVAALVPVPPSLTMTVTPPLGEVPAPPQPASAPASAKTKIGIVLLFMESDLVDAGAATMRAGIARMIRKTSGKC